MISKTCFHLAMIYLPFSIVAELIETPAQSTNEKTISKNEMSVSWSIDEDRISFTMSAPTRGWVAIGLNEKEGIAGTHLLMGRVQSKVAEVVEYYTLSPGNYKPITEIGGKSEVELKAGWEENETTTLSFSIPLRAVCKYQIELQKGMHVNLIMAFSREDDFEHHSVMRTSERIQL